MEFNLFYFLRRIKNWMKLEIIYYGIKYYKNCKNYKNTFIHILHLFCKRYYILLCLNITFFILVIIILQSILVYTAHYVPVKCPKKKNSYYCS